MITRRSFLRQSLASAAFLNLAGAASPLLANAASLAGRQSLHSDLRRRLVVVIVLGGGNDGLNTVIPYRDDGYYKRRPTIAIKREKVLALDDSVGLHPALRPLLELYDDGQLAVVQGVGYPRPSYSHFQSNDIWMTGDVRYPSPLGSGWLARAVTAIPSADRGRFGAMGLGARALPLSLKSPDLVVPAVAAFDSYKVQTDDDSRFDAKLEQTILAGMANLERKDEASGVAFARGVMREALSSVDALQKGVDRYQGGVSYPSTDLGRKLAMAARAVAADLGTRVIQVGFGGFDTHSGQLNQQEQLLGQLAKAIPPFLEDLRAQHRADDTLIVTMSEFGRRVAENGSGGTDHGTAAPLFVIGPGIQGGVHGAHPSLTDLHEDRDLKFTTDFRSVYAAILDGWLGVTSESVLGGRYVPVPFLASAESRVTSRKRPGSERSDDDSDEPTIPRTSVRPIF